MNSEKVKEIKEALECCKQNEIEDTCKYCLDCPASDWDYEKECKIDLFQKTITLINELESDNKSLQDLCNKIYEDLTKEIDRLEKEKTEQLKQFAERLKGKLQDFGDGGEKGAYITEKDIDETLKEFIND